MVNELMSEIAIRVENLGKRYRIGESMQRYQTLREGLLNLATKPMRYFRSKQMAGRIPPFGRCERYPLKCLAGRCSV